MLNLTLLKNPMNWVTVVTMVAVFTVGVDLVRRYASAA